MKSQRRHELQQNTLDAELHKIAAWLKKYGTHLATGILAVAVIILLIVWWTRSAHTASARAQNDFLQAMRLDDDEQIEALRTLADQSDNDRIAAMAAVRLGDAYARRMVGNRTAAERQEFAGQARQWYRRALEDHADLPEAAAQAHLGLAALAEADRDIDKARAEYQAVVNMDAAQGYPARALAQIRLQGLDGLASPVTLASEDWGTTAPAPIPDTVPATVPTTGPTTAPGS